MRVVAFAPSPCACPCVPTSPGSTTSASTAPEYVPLMRLRCLVQGQELMRPGWTLQLDPVGLAFAQRVDGERTIRDIAGLVSRSGVSPATSDELVSFGLAFFESLWRTDFLAIDLSDVSA